VALRLVLELELSSKVEVEKASASTVGAADFEAIAGCASQGLASFNEDPVRDS